MPKQYKVALADLISASRLPTPLKLERVYKGSRLQATVEADGRVQFGGQAHKSLSSAARQAIALVNDGKGTAVDGWTFWKYHDERGELQPLHTLRKRFLGSTKSHD